MWHQLNKVKRETREVGLSFSLKRVGEWCDPGMETFTEWTCKWFFERLFDK